MKKIKKSLSVFLALITVVTTCSVAMPVLAQTVLESNKSAKEQVVVKEEMASKIVREVTELREEETKYFICEDGSYIAASYSEPVHYKENGEWKEINNELELSANVKSRTGKSMYAPKSGAFDIQIPQTFSGGQKVSATNKGYSIKFGVSQSSNASLTKSATVIDDIKELPSNLKVTTASTSVTEDNKTVTYNNEKMAVKNQAGAVVYEDVFSNADLEYVVTANTVKENIVVNKKQNDYTYSFDMDFGGLVPIVNKDNSIKLVDPQDVSETIFYIAAPFMYDANNEESTDIEMSLIEKDGIYVMTLHASADWINDSARVFPVVIDPTVYLSFNDVFVMDGLLNKDSVKINKELRVGRNLTNLTRTYIKPTMPSNIPEGSCINSAYLKLKQDYYFQAWGADDIYIRAVDCCNMKFWTAENISWEYQPFTNKENGYSASFTLSSVLASSSKTTYSFNIKSAVEKWHKTKYVNGIMLASSDESTKTQVDFHSSRVDDSSNHPQMYITYTAPTVSISSWNTDSQAKESSAFTITTSKDWTAFSDSDWISLSATSGSGVGTSKIIVTENTSVEDRTGTVTVKMGTTVIGSIMVTQYGAEPYLALDTSNLNFDVGQIKKTINIESNTAWIFGDLPNWIVVNPSQGSGNATVEIESHINNTSDSRTCNISVTADTVTKTINVNQSSDKTPPAIPNLYEEDGLVYMSLHSVDFDETTDTAEHLEYKLGNGEWIDYEDEPLSVIRTHDTTIYARTCDIAGNVSEEASLVLECDIGEYTASYTDIVLGEGVLPIGFERTYSSEDGWFFTFEANVAACRNGYVFTDFYGNKQYFIINNEGKYVSANGEELLKVDDGKIRQTEFLYKVSYGEMICYFNKNGKLAAVEDDYNTATYAWDDDTLYVKDEAGEVNIVKFIGGKPIYISTIRLEPETNVTLSKNVQYQWSNDNIIKFVDAANVTHNYDYTHELLTTNEGETITYSSDGRVKKITQANGAFVKYTYNDTAASADEDAPGNIGAVTVFDSKGVTDTWYYADGFTISNGLYSYSDNATYAPNNISGEITTDTLSQIAYVMTVPADEAEEYYEEYPIYEEDDDGNFTFYAYDSENNVTAVLFVKAGSLTGAEEPTFEQAETVAEEKTTYVYDTNDNVTEEVYQKRVDGTIVNIEKTVYSYNEEESILTQSNYQWLDGTWYQTYGESYTYNGYGNVTSKTTETYTNTENSDTGMIEVSLDTTTVKYKYDAWCQQVEIETIDGEDTTISQTVYDVFGRTISVTADGKTIAYTYDSRGNVLTLTEAGETTSYSYADNGNLVSITNPNGAIAVYTYDAYGNLTGHTFNGYEFTYNTLGSILVARSESGELVNYTYSNTVEQEVLTSNFGNGQNVVYTYNEDGEITAIKLGEETKYGYEYFETTDGNGEVTKEWTELTDYVNNLKKTIEENKTTVKELNGNFIYSVENVSADEEAENSFDGVITTIGNDVYTLVTEDKNDIFKTNETVDFTREYTYVNDDLTKVKTAGVTTLFDYNSDKLISVLENTLNDVSKVYGYAYDDNGNITSETVTTKDESGNVLTNETITYTYDNNEQLVSAETSSKKYEYSYDDRGNILTKKEYAITVDENGEKAYTLMESSTDTYVYDETWKDKLISYNGQTITYDAIGNPINYMGNALTWTMGRQLASFGNISYSYNEDGIRTSKTSNGVTTKFYLDGTNIIEQTDGTTTIYFFYDSAGEIIGFKYNGNNYFYVKNSMGDIVAIADATSNLIASYTYDAWGKVISVTGSNTEIGNLNPFRYRSYYYDSDIQMYYLQSRYYDAEVGRFINSDDISIISVFVSDDLYNAFSYCNNNPVNNIDILGNISLESVKEFFKDLMDKLATEIKNYLLSLIVLKNGRVHVSNSVIGGAIDLVISSFLVGKVYKTAEKVIGYFIEKVAKKDPTNVYKALYYVLTLLKNKYVLKYLAKKVVNAFGLKASLVSTVANDFVSYFVTNKVRILNKISIYASAFSSIGGCFAFIMDCTDGYCPADGYYTLRMLKYKYTRTRR